jgi:hypothetical protein
MVNRSYVWVVGFPRCGTTSLCEALGILGWNVIHNPRHWDQLQGHNAAGDVMITAHWRELNNMFPNSKFILNTRNFDDWIISLQRIPGFWQSRMMFDKYYQQSVYGGYYPSNKNGLKIMWDRHHKQIQETIKPQNLLMISLPFLWEPLCEFLQVTIPKVQFPWRNRGHAMDVRVRK